MIDSTSTEHPIHTLSVSAEECGIQTLPFETISAIWVKAEQYLNSERDIVPAPGNDSKAMMVTSKSSVFPHFVSSSSQGQYSCDNGCLQWKSSKICAHTVAVAEKNGDLHAFLEWYICTNQEPNITALAMSGLPSGRGRKGGVPKRKRSVASQRTQPEVVVHRPATRPHLPATTVYSSASCDTIHSSSARAPPSIRTCGSGPLSRVLLASASLSGQVSAGSPSPSLSGMLPSVASAASPTVGESGPLSGVPLASTSLSGQVGAGCPSPSLSGMLPSVASAASPTVGGSGISPSTTMTGVPPSTLNLSNLFPTLFGSLPFTVTQSINSSSINAAVSQSQTLTLHPNVAPDNNITNSNPFFIRFIAGNIRMCQGCRSSLRSIDGGIPQPPFDLAIARFERRSYRDKNGELKTPVREQAAHYHLNVSCVKAVSPCFIPAQLVIPSDILSSLSATHKEYLRLMFGVSLH